MEGMLVQHRVTPNIKFASAHLYTWVEKEEVYRLFHQDMQKRIISIYMVKMIVKNPVISVISMLTIYMVGQWTVFFQQVVSDC